MQTTSRKPHRKVRTGCRVCKSRKIKCDENKPSCNNCIKHSVSCDIMTTSTALAPSPNPSLNGTPTNAFSPMSVTGPSHSPHQLPLPSIPILDGHGSSFTLLDMELLHHYTTSTFMTVVSNPSLATLWRINIPQLACSHEIVMRGILSIAALHIAYYKPEKRDFYVSTAVSHHQNALASAITMMDDVNDDNCTALHIFTSITLIYSLASPRKSLDLIMVGENDVSDWVTLLKGVRAIADHAHEKIYQGSLRPMFSAGARRDKLRRESSSYPPNQYLVNLSEFLTASISDPHDLETYIESINELQKSYAVLLKVGRDNFESADLFIWPYRVSDHYTSLLRQRTAPALVVYAYFAVLMKCLDAHWWMKGWSEYLIAQIYGLLDAEHRVWIRGAIEEIGWVP
ncbi:dc7210a3-4701-4f3c-bfb1-19806323dcef [Sclerotinia trifoliorum]|uniref:Dc7210a3-4701-4f3c-bfb1-19806323dcef n=1 Tax=Sclerotinia trifoliorum TaxID=28548 RepID=A0A8H2VP05_9HELO|nr:dc7210a3-4701-4f3c-bfb1-19806323dcef [Sclerotinia trifoliorum]